MTRLEECTVGVLANGPKYLGGAVDSDGSDQGAIHAALRRIRHPRRQFLRHARHHGGDRRRRRPPWSGMRPRMFLTSSNMTVPYFTIVLRKAYGLGQSAMAGGNYRAPYFYVSWSTGELAPMGIEGQVKLGFRAELAAIENPEERLRFFEEMVAKAYETGKALHRSTNLMVDDVIDPAETRTWVVNRLAAIRPAPARTGKKRPMIDAL
ncbi:acetyl-CoA carboxylase carboxyltransferase component [Constrictibacter sp. MBR-5]